VLAGEIRDLILNLPPRNTKSSIASIAFPAFAWATKPAMKFLFASFKESLALEHSQACRDILGSSWYADRWPAVKIRADKDAKQMFQNTETGYRASVSVGANATGLGGDIILVDDPHALSDTFSDADREAVIRWWTGTMSSRLNDRETGARVIIGQRVHEADLTGFLLKQGGWTHVRIPAEYTPEKSYSSPIGANDPRKEAGELLWPKRFSRATQQSIKQENGAFAYSSQQMQDPSPGEAGAFHRKHFRYFSIEDAGTSFQVSGKRIPVGSVVLFQTFDTATKTSDLNDYTVGETFGITPENDLLVLDVVRLRIPVPNLYHFTQEMRQKYPAILYQFVEDKSSGMGLIQEGARSPFPFLNLAERLKEKGIANILSGDKMQRAVTAAILYESGKVYHLAGAPWLADFESELLHFPVGAHDDMVDALAYGAICLRYGPRSRGGLGIPMVPAGGCICPPGPHHPNCPLSEEKSATCWQDQFTRLNPSSARDWRPAFPEPRAWPT
jgi:predicted phage terminase large subunit-like protein